MMLNEEQIEGHFLKFQRHWNKNVLPNINAAIMEGEKITEFDAGRMFENLWLDYKSSAEVDYLEHSGQLDV